MPFNVGIGGLFREYRTLPLVGKMLKNSLDNDIELYIPFNAFRALYKYFLSFCNHDPKCAYEFLIKHVEEDLSTVEKRSRYSISVNEKMVEVMLFNLREHISRGNVSIFGFARNIIYDLVKSYSLTSHISFFGAQYYISREEIRHCQSFSYYFKGVDYIYVTHETVDALSSAMCLSRLNKSKIIILLHNPPERYERVLLNNILSSNSLILIGILGVSPASFLGLPDRHVQLRVVFPGNAIELETPERISLQKNERLIIYFGRLSREKGFFDLLKAWTYVEKEAPNLMLLIVGSPDTEFIRRKILEYSRKYNVRWLPPQKRHKLIEYVASSKVFVLPSYREGYSLSILEALSLKTSVVAYRIPALYLLYRRLPNVLLVDTGNIKQLAEAIIRMSELEFQSDSLLDIFLYLHSSWENVARAEFETLMSIISH
jgi:glycosyltransferase involved in cell wall biosynthesis